MQRQIENTQQYNSSLERVYGLMQMDLLPGSQEWDELETLSILVKEYENIHYPIPKPQLGKIKENLLRP
ncbi:hypothetical protein [Chitinophaga sp. YIM B06452]|uniref:hypothetical protein n=1 Tax=Chitinophaga sp. YIM B06452 TaxID=3082158 RepID=UPI0031FE8B8C